jgi:hypothetical protein
MGAGKGAIELMRKDLDSLRANVSTIYDSTLLMEQGGCERSVIIRGMKMDGKKEYQDATLTLIKKDFLTALDINEGDIYIESAVRLGDQKS